jgi:hypothetical protein
MTRFGVFLIFLSTSFVASSAEDPLDVEFEGTIIALNVTNLFVSSIANLSKSNVWHRKKLVKHSLVV